MLFSQQIRNNNLLISQTIEFLTILKILKDNIRELWRMTKEQFIKKFTMEC